MWRRSTGGCEAAALASRIPCGEGVVWLAAVRDAFSTRIVGSRCSDLVYRQSWRTREEAENELFAYMDGRYNTERIQPRLGWLSPDEYEAAWHTQQGVLDDQPASPADGADPAPVS